MAPRTDARQCARVICALAVVLAVYSLTVGRPGGGATVHYSVLTQHDASDKKYNAKDADSVLADNDSNKAIKSTLKLHCSPLKDKTLSSAISSSDKGYVHMIPRPKIITFKDGVAQQVLSFGSSVLMSIEHVNVSTDPALDMTFLLDRLCSMSHTFDSSADNPAVVNGSSIEYLHRVRAVMLSPEAFTVCCTNSEVPLGALDEAYSINISGGVALVYTPGSRGLRSALASIAQLLENAAPLPPSLTVLDWPSYRWRGLMLDTARHFIPVRKIYRALDAMFAVKLNYLHIHLTDSQVYGV